MRVLIINDDVNTMPVVAHALMAVCGASGAQAWEWTQHVHLTGHAEVANALDPDAAEAVALRLLRYGVRAMVLP
ncbi:ATP-dependent Clp protease adaptor ClpS [Actinokineospora guangxiensis]|uniref:ATP-dependent Clp protease adaptor ClpS n=1 Tax=Actinokineospora guangxiensis TaxID=1490288 RepID=A0ABW0ET87_9PSEU